MSLLLALAATPGMLGTQEAIRQGQQRERREEHRARRCNVVARCIKHSDRAQEINGRPMVLRDGAMYIDTCTQKEGCSDHPYTGYYLPYPDSSYEGLVTTITEDAPILNWVYIDAYSCQLRYGQRKDAQPNLTGPFDCTRQDRRLTFQNWEGFCVVEIEPDIWAVFFDIEDDGLKGRVRAGTLQPGLRILEIELQRVEKRSKRDELLSQTTQNTHRGKNAVARQSSCDEVHQPEHRLPSESNIIPSAFLATTKSVDTAPNLEPVLQNLTGLEHNSNQASTQLAFLEARPSPTRHNTGDSSEIVETDPSLFPPTLSPRSATVIQVEPPVILSTHEMSSRQKQRTRPSRASDRYIAQVRSVEQSNTMEAQTATAAVRKEKSLLAEKPATPSTSTSDPVAPPSRTRKFFSRIGRTMSTNRVRKTEPSSADGSKNSSRCESNHRVSGSDSTQERPGPRGGGFKKSSDGLLASQNNVTTFHPHKDHPGTDHPAVTRFRRSLSMGRSARSLGVEDEPIAEPQPLFRSWRRIT